MPQYGRKFCFEVLTMDGKNFVADAVSVTFPATDGMVGVLAGRAPLIASIGIGTLSVQDDQGKHKYYFVAGGFARVRENAMTLLADICQPLEQINADEAHAELEKATALAEDNAHAKAYRKRQLQIANSRLALLEKQAK